METIGVRELRLDASRWLARARAGEIFVVTDRGRPVAQLGPLPPAVGYAALVADGRIARGWGQDMTEVLADLDAALPPDDGSSVSGALADLRAGER